MRNSVIADTCFWYALINADDAFHRQATETLQALTATLITTWPVITEISYFLQSRMGQTTRGLSVFGFIQSRFV